MVNYYQDLQRFFSAVMTLNSDCKDAFNVIIEKDYSPRLLSVTEYEHDDDANSITFDLRRVCRLSHEYVCYLYKLYLEYRGRKPFQTINLIRQEEATLPVEYNKNTTEAFLTFYCVPVPDKSNRKDWPWVIDLQELNRIVETLIGEKVSNSEGEIIVKDENTTINLQNGKKLILTKTRKKVCLRVNG